MLSCVIKSAAPIKSPSFSRSSSSRTTTNLPFLISSKALGIELNQAWVRRTGRRSCFLDARPVRLFTVRLLVVSPRRCSRLCLFRSSKEEALNVFVVRLRRRHHPSDAESGCFLCSRKARKEEEEEEEELEGTDPEAFKEFRRCAQESHPDLR